MTTPTTDEEPAAIGAKAEQLGRAVDPRELIAISKRPCRREREACRRDRDTEQNGAAVDISRSVIPIWLLNFVGTLTVQTVQLRIRLSQIPCQDRYLHVAFDPDANLKEIRKRNANEGP